jgi:hypothetical protein
VVRPRSCRVIYYFDTPALGRRHQSFGRVTSSIDLEENSNFHVFNDSLVDVDTEELNVVLSSTSGKKNVVEEDDNEIEECDEADDNNSIEDEDENSD